MSATEPVARAALRARLGRRSWLGAAAGVAFSGLVLGSLAWVVAGWVQIPRGWLAYCAVATAAFAALEVGVQRRSRAGLEPVIDLLVDCVHRLPAPEVGQHRGLPWVSGERGGRRFTALVEWDGGERLRLGLTVDAALPVTLRLVPATADDRPDRWLSRLRVRHRHRDVPGLPPSVVGLSPEPALAESLWGADAEAADELEAMTAVLSPRAAVVDVQPEGVGWDGPLDDDRLDITLIDGLLGRLVAVADRLEADASASAHSG